MLFGLYMFLGLAGLAFWYGKSECAAKDTGRGAFYGIGVIGIIGAIAMVMEMIKAGSF